MELTLQDISKRYGSKQAVSQFNLTLTDGVYGLLGPNGAGKTTLMRLLCGLQTPTAGVIYWNGKQITDIGERYYQQLGYLPQHLVYEPTFTVQEFLQYMAALKGLPPISSREKIAQLLEAVGLYRERHKRIQQLSGGMKQRVGIARALVHNPDILILDQPLGALDAITRKMLSYEILNIWKKTQKTVIMVTNSVDEAILLANRIFVFSNKPAVITHEIQVDIPVEQRNHEIANNQRFNELREQINEIVRATL